ncbi:MAG: hypothetical protein ACK5YE_24910 [Planctomyces sp.]
MTVDGAAWDRFGENAAFFSDYSAGSYRNPGFGLGMKKTRPHAGGAKGVKEQSGGKLESGAKARASENGAFTG